MSSARVSFVGLEGVENVCPEDSARDLFAVRVVEYGSGVESACGTERRVGGDERVYGDEAKDCCVCDAVVTARKPRILQERMGTDSIVLLIYGDTRQNSYPGRALVYGIGVTDCLRGAGTSTPRFYI